MSERTWKEELSEYGALHNEDCCVNFEDSRSCDCDVGEVDCCDNMKMIAGFFSEQVEKIIDHISHDMDCKDEEQRKEVVKIYVENLINNPEKPPRTSAVKEKQK